MNLSRRTPQSVLMTEPIAGTDEPATHNKPAKVEKLAGNDDKVPGVLVPPDKSSF